jgi:hypothetical protein
MKEFIYFDGVNPFPYNIEIYSAGRMTMIYLGKDGDIHLSINFYEKMMEYHMVCGDHDGGGNKIETREDLDELVAIINNGDWIENEKAIGV